MPPVALEITNPLNGAVLTGAGPANLQGRVLSAGHPPLLYRWYSSLNAPADEAQAALNWNDAMMALDVRAATVALPAGTQVITLSAKDRAGEDLASLQQVQFAGMAGGPADSAAPCVITVLWAAIVEAAATLSKAAAVLEAAAPFNWLDPAYAAINRLAFRWRFTPRGAPAGRASAVLPPETPMTFLDPIEGPPAKPARLRFSGPLPAILDLGAYTLALRAELKDAPATFHEATRDITIVG